MSNKNNAKTFLTAMSNVDPAEVETPATTKLRAVPKAPPAAPKSEKRTAASRANLKHFGGYLDAATMEKAALLRLRLKLDNSELIKLALDELARKHDAKRAFGDA